jgi:hypothetical protein
MEMLWTKNLIAECPRGKMNLPLEEHSWNEENRGKVRTLVDLCIDDGFARYRQEFWVMEDR